MDVISQRWGNGRYYHICRLNYDLSRSENTYSYLLAELI